MPCIDDTNLSKKMGKHIIAKCVLSYLTELKYRKDNDNYHKTH